jgi:hypothetical protein
MRLTSEKQIPQKVATCAQDHKLGVPRIIYEPSSASHFYLILSSFAFVVSAAIIGAYVFLYEQIFSSWPIWQAWMVVGMGVAWFSIGLWLLMQPIAASHLQIFLCPKGLIYHRHNYEVIRWDRISQLSKELTLDRKSILLSRYKILRDDGKTFLLDSDLPHLDRLGGFMEREITRHLLPEVIRAYDAGETPTFADLAVTAQGIVAQHVEQFLSWYEFERVSIDETTISIYRLGDVWAWVTLNISDFPNVWIFKGLLEYATKRARVPSARPLAIETKVEQKPSQIQAYDAGMAISFGPLSLSLDGISIHDNAILLPWEEIASFGIGEHEIIIKKIGSSSQWYTLPIWTISDATRLKQLVDYALFQQYL